MGKMAYEKPGAWRGSTVLVMKVEQADVPRTLKVRVRVREPEGAHPPRRRRSEPLNESGLIWHYTTRERFANIRRDGSILPARTLLLGKPAVWFSSNTQWEPTAAPGLQRGAMRIGVDPASAPVTWPTYKAESGIGAVAVEGLEEVGRVVGSDPSQWFCSFDAIPSSKWRRVEMFDGKHWQASLELR